MPQVKIKNNQIAIDQKKIPLISGEVHYWRLNPNYWKEVLSRVREMGLNVIATYIPWDYHEYQKGKFDFTGITDKTRDLKAFLNLTRREKFWVIIRPGPYIYSEWPNDGVPSYARKYHRLHPKFLEYSQNYLNRVVKVLAPFMASRSSGHIIMLQADNEIDPWPDIFGYQYGLGDTPGMFQNFLRTLYRSQIGDLNDCWGTQYESFEEAGPFIATMLKEEGGLPLKGDKELKRNIDYLKFKYFYSTECAKWNVQAYRKQNVKVPVYLNLYPFFYAHDWKQMQDVSDMVGVDFYPSAEFSEDAFEQRKMMDKIRYLRSVSTLPYIAEFAAGVWHARHYETGVLTPNHYRLITLTALLAGIRGWNWYMLVNRDNWYMSPINEWGRVRGELFHVFQQMVSVFKRIDPPSLEKICEVAVTFNPLQYAARTLTHNSPIMTALYDSDIDYEITDARFGRSSKKFLFYSGNQWLETESQKNLRRYVEGGGTLIAFRDYPRKDDRFRPSSVIGFEDPHRILFEFKKEFTLQLAANRPKIKVVSSVYCFGKNTAGELITADFGPAGKGVIGYIKKIGKGRLIHLGVEPTKELVMEVLAYLKVPIASHSVTRDVKTALFRRGNKYYLIAVNNGSEDKSASVYLPALEKLNGRMRIREIPEGENNLHPRERRKPFTFEIPRKDGKVFEFQT